MGLLSGRSRHAIRKVRSHHASSSATPRKKTAEKEDGEDVKKPDIDELRERRASYYDVPPAERMRRSTSSTLGPNSDPRIRTTSRSSTITAQNRKKRKHKSSSSSRTTRSVSGSQARTEEYVYGPRVADEPSTATPNSVRGEHERLRTERRRSRQTGSSHQPRLPTVFESEVTPEESVSQVGERDASETPKRKQPTRPSLKRSSTTSSKLLPVVERSRGSPSVVTSKRSSRHESTTLNSLSRRHSTSSVPSAPRLVECLTCGSDDIPSTQTAKLACSHRMCHDCLKRIFEMSVKDPAHMPPKCCTDQHIPLRHVDKLFDVKFKMLWNRKYQEYHTKNRIYCPTLKCGEWIKPSHIHTSKGRRYALCPRCQTKVCTTCNNKMHKSSDCPKDPEIAKLVEQAKEKGWQRCYSCSALVERREGCNHMTCRCKAEFCIVCGDVWKTCDCPWFSNTMIPPDRLNDMRVPEPIQVIFRQAFGGAGGPIPPAPRIFDGPPPVPAANARDNRRPQATYQQEIEQRRRQERTDAELAQRLQLASLLGQDDEEPARHGEEWDLRGIGNAARHFLNDDFVQNAANVVMNAFGDANIGIRGERQSGRRRRARQTRQNGNDPGPDLDIPMDVEAALERNNL